MIPRRAGIRFRRPALLRLQTPRPPHAARAAPARSPDQRAIADFLDALSSWPSWASRRPRWKAIGAISKANARWREGQGGGVVGRGSRGPCSITSPERTHAGILPAQQFAAALDPARVLQTTAYDAASARRRSDRADRSAAPAAIIAEGAGRKPTSMHCSTHPGLDDTDRPARSRDVRIDVRLGPARERAEGPSVAALNLRQGVVRVTGKGNKERMVPLGEEAQHWLQRYLNRIASPKIAGKRAL